MRVLCNRISPTPRNPNYHPTHSKPRIALCARARVFSNPPPLVLPTQPCRKGRVAISGRPSLGGATRAWWPYIKPAGGTGYLGMEVNAREPIRVALSAHNEVATRDAPHLPGAVVTRRHHDGLAGMHGNRRYRHLVPAVRFLQREGPYWRRRYRYSHQRIFSASRLPSPIPRVLVGHVLYMDGIAIHH
jgi:hypothetical protein